MIIADKNKIIKYVNKSFTKSTGYLPQDVIGKKPSILSANLQSDEFYKELTKTINNGQTWRGELINMDKMGMLIYEKATIMPIFENDKIIEFIAIKLDITKEKIAQQKLIEKEKLLIQQSKMASMGEMLENIAHQWRQPLNVISTASTGILTCREYGLSTEAKEIQALNNINESAQYLSQTINDFRDFLKDKNVKDKFSIKQACEKTISLIESKFQNSGIEIIKDMTDIHIYGSRNEFTQVAMNLLSNASDALTMKSTNKRKLILISLHKEKNKVIFKLKDSGGGIPSNIIDRIFEPYFTTKHKAQGTGIGLYMSMEMISKHMSGLMSVENKIFKHEGISYLGACFTIKLPIDRRK